MSIRLHHVTATSPTSRAATTAATAAPCKGCGTTRGAIPPRHVSPWRARGLCLRCYARRHQHGEFCRDNDIPATIPTGLSPTLRRSRAVPICTGLAIVKYHTPTWRTYGPRTNPRRAA
jgi:hypothetical protein